MNKKVKTVLTFGVGFFVGAYATTAVEEWLCREGRMYTYFKVSDREFGDRKIVPPSSGRYHWNDSEKKEEVPE